MKDFYVDTQYYRSHHSSNIHIKGKQLPCYTMIKHYPSCGENVILDDDDKSPKGCRIFIPAPNRKKIMLSIVFNDFSYCSNRNMSKKEIYKEKNGYIYLESDDCEFILVHEIGEPHLDKWNIFPDYTQEKIDYIKSKTEDYEDVISNETMRGYVNADELLEIFESIQKGTFEFKFDY